jgi:hypothetical protein
MPKILVFLAGEIALCRGIVMPSVDDVGVPPALGLLPIRMNTI